LFEMAAAVSYTAAVLVVVAVVMKGRDLNLFEIAAAVDYATVV
jgi:hypothetical protein